MIKVIASYLITGKHLTHIPTIMLDKLKLKVGDEIVFTLINGNVYVKKYFKDMQLNPGEEYISSNTINKYRGISLSLDVIDLIDSNLGGRIIWLIDNNGNFIIRNNFLYGDCSKKIINKNVSSLIIGFTALYENGRTAVPKEVYEPLGIIGDAQFSIDIEDNDIIISKDFKKNSIITNVYYGQKTGIGLFIILNKQIRDILNTDKILWIVDEYGNFIIKNNNFPLECLILKSKISR
jgi:bifunctional DNA-binding transcriptional regulator/antitoxin component of YhaV-PrlF toxin-antitoxin module